MGLQKKKEEGIVNRIYKKAHGLLTGAMSVGLRIAREVEIYVPRCTGEFSPQEVAEVSAENEYRDPFYVSVLMYAASKVFYGIQGCVLEPYDYRFWKHPLRHAPRNSTNHL
jgi:hypothetical protein